MDLQKAALQIHEPRTPRELWDYCAYFWNIRIPYTKVHPEHSAPFAACVAFYFATHPVIVVQGARGLAGKCQASDEIALFPDGVRRTWGEAEKLKELDVFVPSHGKTATSRGYLEGNGVQACSVITLESGIKVTRTNNHPVYSAKITENIIPSQAGFHPVEDLLVGDLCLVPDSFPEPAQAEYRSNAEIILVGLLLGDGGTAHSNIVLSGAGATLDIFDLAVSEFGGSTRRERMASVIRYDVGKGRDKKKTGLWKVLDESGLLKAEHKKFPDWVWKLSNKQLSLFLNCLWATDGWIGVSHRGGYAHKNAEFQVVSKQLRDDLAIAMHRVGVPGFSRDKGPGSYKKNGVKIVCQDRFSWTVYPDFLEAFLSRLGIVIGKEVACLELEKALASRTKTNQQSKWRKKGPAGYHWQRIVSITERICQTTALCVPEGNLFCGPIVEHNSVILATLAITEQVSRAADVMVASGTAEQSARIMAYMRGKHEAARGKFWGCENAPTWMLRKIGSSVSIIENVDKITKEIKEGRVQCVSSSETALRGEHPSKLILDEIDSMKLKSVESVFGTTMDVEEAKDCIILSGTHHIPNGTFTEMKRRAHDKGWPIFKWGYEETCKPFGWLSPAAVERKRAQVGEEQWRVEYDLGEPSIEGRYFATEIVEDNFDILLGEAYGSFDQYLEFEAPQPGVQYYHGTDWGRKAHNTVIMTFRRGDQEGFDRLVAYERTGLHPWPVLCEKLNARVRRFPGSSAHDASGVGEALGGGIDPATSELIAGYLTVPSNPTFSTSGFKREFGGDYTLAFENKRIKYPRILGCYDVHKYLTGDQMAGYAHMPDDLAAAIMARYARRMTYAAACADVEPEQSRPYEIRSNHHGYRYAASMDPFDAQFDYQPWYDQDIRGGRE